MNFYRHTQAGTVIRWALLAGLLPLTALAWLPAIPPTLVVLLLALAIVTVASTLLLWSLTIEISPAHFKFWFGPGLIGKTVALVDITACDPVDGIRAWGIHWAGKKGWLYNVSGFQALSISLKNGQRFMVGTDEPASVCEALAKARQRFDQIAKEAY
jgi:hypothetical protein